MNCSLVTTPQSRKSITLMNRRVIIGVLKKLMSGRAKVTQEMILKKRFTVEEQQRDLDAIREAVKIIENCTCQKDEG